MSDFEHAFETYLQGLEHEARRRRLRRIDAATGVRVEIAGKAYVNFSANDYLGLADHPEMVRRTQDYAARWGAGSRASRLVTGDIKPFTEIEAKIAAAKHTEDALVFVSGFQANASVLPAMLDASVLGGEPLVFADRLNHASMHHGIAASGLRQIRYRHRDLAHLDALLANHAGDQRPKVVIAESVFSMDGDRTDIGEISALARAHGAFLYLDEAHATGVLGDNGFGLVKGDQADLIMGTFSKALGCFGAYVACSRRLKQVLVNRCTGLIYATALPPAVLGAMDAALDLVPSLGDRRDRVLGLAAYARHAFQRAGLDTGDSDTQILPVILGSTERALAVAHGLEAAGMLGIAIRPPTVPKGASRIRLAFSAAHEDADVERLIETTIALAAPR